MPDKDLKPCPFCGGKAQIRYTKGNPNGWTSNVYYGSYAGFVKCINCGLQTQKYTRVCKAVDVWNNRVQPDKESEQGEKI